MWFKNIKLYRFSQPFDMAVEDIEERLQAHAFAPCGKQDRMKFGWVPPLGRHGTELTHTCAGAIMLCAQKQEKVLPAAVVNEKLQDRALEIEHKEGRKLYRKERDQLKDDVIASLLPQAFPRNQKLFAYLDPKERWLVIDSSSNSKAEELLHHLRQSLDSLPVIPPSTKQLPVDILTQWVEQGHGSDDFAIGDECEFFNPKEEGSIIRCKGQDLQCDEIQAHLQAGMQVKQLAVVWQDSIHCVIDQDLGIKRLRFADVITAKAEEADAEDAAQQFDQDFAVMSLELNKFFKALTRAMGGLQRKRADLGVEEAIEA